MNWLKIAAVAIGALIAFFIVGSVIHLITAILGWVVVLALVGGGGYVVYKIATSGRGRSVRNRHRDRELRDDYRPADYPPPPPPPPSRPNVDDDLDRLRREMGH
ncbi:MAG TPA: hypothetical protein VH478_17755 [Trebonia sp.]|nr:hypothetical protein [Trebonia sp.]